MEDWTKELTPEMIPEELYKEFSNELTIDMIPDGIFKEIGLIVGLANLIKLAELVGGTTFYIPKAESFLRPVRDVHIKTDFTGYNHTELAIKYNLSEKWIRKICGEGHIKGQIDLFGLQFEE